MSNEQIMCFKEALSGIMHHPAKAWVYLPKGESWNLNSRCAIMESEEVTPELEDESDAGIPIFAKQNNLMQVLPVTVVQDIVTNARTQKANLAPEGLLSAFEYYYKHDAFIVL